MSSAFDSWSFDCHLIKRLCPIKHLRYQVRTVMPFPKNGTFVYGVPFAWLGQKLSFYGDDFFVLRPFYYDAKTDTFFTPTVANLKDIDKCTITGVEVLAWEF